jgi:hypothetical protein
LKRGVGDILTYDLALRRDTDQDLPPMGVEKPAERLCRTPELCCGFLELNLLGFSAGGEALDVGDVHLCRHPLLIGHAEIEG